MSDKPLCYKARPADPRASQTMTSHAAAWAFGG